VTVKTGKGKQIEAAIKEPGKDCDQLLRNANSDSYFHACLN